jgi:hypothetical protein
MKKKKASPSTSYADQRCIFLMKVSKCIDDLLAEGPNPIGHYSFCYWEGGDKAVSVTVDFMDALMKGKAGRK